ncbi:MAG: hypothetical protein H6Q33_1573 [Deltaproteobacteria bacterium]|nr:hypothetical protein [Deltaproteobacteria bacterium]
MTNLKSLIAVTATTGAILLSSAAYAGSTKTYQVTGPVLEVKDDMIAVQKGKDRWEIGRDAGTKVTGDLAPGATVTIQYRMTATDVEVKPAKGAKKK